MTRDLDPRMTFETFVVGPANRLAAAAARRAADSPGTSYNPLFIYSPSGLGKSHILTAIAHHASRVHPEATVVYQTMEGYLDELAEALEAGERDRLKEQYAGLDIFLLDDVQFLSGQPEAQELLLRTLDTLSVSGSQIALASDRPPAEIDALDDRLLSRFSGGLIVDIAQPEFETRVAIIRRKAEERGMDLEEGVAEAVARHPFKNVRELGGALNRVFAVQDLEDRRVTSDEIPDLLGLATEPAGEEGGGDEFGTFVDELSSDLATTVKAQEAPWRVLLRETAEKAEEQGFRTGRLRRLLERDEEPADVEEIVEGFKEDLDRLREIGEELEAVGNPWPDAAATVLNDPERIDEAEALLASAQERARPFPPVPEGPELGDLAGKVSPLAVKAAAKLVEEGRSEYNPLFVWSEGGDLARILLEATARSFQKTRERPGRVALISASEFAGEFIEALSSGVAGAWRERWWEVDLLLVFGLEALSHTERAQDEFFHLFEALKRREAWVMLAADRPPTGIANVDERLRSRFEGGLVVEVEEVRSETTEEPTPEAPAESGESGGRIGAEVGPGAPPRGASDERSATATASGSTGAPGSSGAGAAPAGTGEEARPEGPAPESGPGAGSEAGAGPVDAHPGPATEAGSEATSEVAPETPPGATSDAGPQAAPEAASFEIGEPDEAEEEADGVDRSVLTSPENVIWDWPDVDERIIEE